MKRIKKISSKFTSLLLSENKIPLYVNNILNIYSPYKIGYFYIFISIVVFTSIVLILNVYVLHLKIETAVASTRIENIISPQPGIIKEIFVSKGQNIKKGRPLIKIEDANLERDLELAKIAAETAKIDCNYFKKLLAIEKEKLNFYSTIGANKITSTLAIVNQAKSDALNSKNNLNRMQKLHKKHYISDNEWDDITTKYKIAVEKIKSLNAQMDIENKSLSIVKNGMYFTGEKLEGIENDLNAQIETANDKLKMAQDRIKVYEHMISKLTLLAPFDGKISQIIKSPGTIADNNKPILLLENSNAIKTITAYLTQQEIIHVGIHSKVKIFIPASGETFHGYVSSIDRTNGFVDEINQQFKWRDYQLDRSAMVTVNINPDDYKKFNQNVMSGFPAIVYFKRKFTIL